MEKLEDILSRVLRIAKEKIRDELTPQDVAEWDSLNALILVSALESNYGIKFISAEVVSVKCIGDIKTILRNKGANLDGK